MRAAAEVLEGAVAVQRDRLDALVADQVLDQLDLVVLALLPEQLDRLGGRDVAALERLVGLDVARSSPPRSAQVVLAGGVLAEVDVVVEAVGDRRADRDLRLRPELEHRLGEHVGGVVADQLERLRGVGGDDLDLLAARERAAEVAQLAVGLDRERRLGEAGADRGRRVGARSLRRRARASSRREELLSAWFRAWCASVAPDPTRTLARTLAAATLCEGGCCKKTEWKR